MSYEVTQVFVGLKEVPKSATDRSDLERSGLLNDIDWDLDIYLSYPESLDDSAITNDNNEEDWEYEELEKFMVQDGVRFATREDRSYDRGISRILSNNTSDEEQEKRIVRSFRVKFTPDDITLYRANGAEYRNDKRCALAVRKVTNRRR